MKPNLKQILSDMEEGKIVSKAFVKEALEYAVELEDCAATEQAERVTLEMQAKMASDLNELRAIGADIEQINVELGISQPAERAAEPVAVTDEDLRMLRSVANYMRRSESPRCSADLLRLAEKLAAAPASADVGELPKLGDELVSELLKAVEIARHRAQHAGAVNMRKHWEEIASRLRSAAQASSAALPKEST